MADDSTMRRATVEDLDDLTDIMCSAMPMDPQWDYRFPRRQEFPEDNRSCTRKMMESLVNDDENSHTVVRVITIPCGEEGRRSKAVAVAVWRLQFFNVLDLGKKVDCDDRRDADFPRMKAFDIALTKAKKYRLDTAYGDRQVHLMILATHPDHQRQGAGTRHCQWGMELAKEKNSAVTLFSSPMGTRLYTELEFKILDYVTVQVVGEEKKLSIGVMAYDKAFLDR